MRTVWRCLFICSILCTVNHANVSYTTCFVESLFKKLSFIQEDELLRNAINWWHIFIEHVYYISIRECEIILVLCLAITPLQ